MKILNMFGIPKTASEHMFNSLTPFVVKVQYFGKLSSCKAFDYRFRPKNADFSRHFLTEGLYTSGPACDYVKIADGKNSMVIDMNNGTISHVMKTNPFTTTSTFMKRMQKVIDKFQAN